MSKSKKRKPLMESFGYISLDSFIIYEEKSPYGWISEDKCLRCKKSDNPRLFIDLEMVKDIESSAYKGLQIHMALSGMKVHSKKFRRVQPKTGVDVYLSKDQALSLYKLLGNLLKQLGLL